MCSKAHLLRWGDVDLKTVCKLAEEYDLQAPDEFWELSLEDLEEIVGAEGRGHKHYFSIWDFDF